MSATPETVTGDQVAEMREMATDDLSRYESEPKTRFLQRSILRLCDALSVARSQLAEAQAVIAAARKMPRETPAPGGAGTVHDFKISAATVWALDAALTKLDAARSTPERGDPEGPTWGCVALRSHGPCNTVNGTDDASCGACGTPREPVEGV